MSSVNVLKLPGDYIVQTNSNESGISQGGNIVLDVGALSGVSTGTVTIHGNLVVNGLHTSLKTIDSTIRDNTIVLNSGELGTNTVSKGTAGIKISRGNSGNDDDNVAAFLEWNDAAHWQGTGALSSVRGVWEFRTGNKTQVQYSAIKINAIRIDNNSASTVNSGADENPRLNIFGSDNPTAVISVSGTNDYKSRVTDPDDIPNKAYVDYVLVGSQLNSPNLVDGNSFIKIIDQSIDNIPSYVIGVLNGNSTERLNITTGTVVLRLTETSSKFSTIQFINNVITPVNHTNLLLSGNGAGSNVVLTSPVIENSTSTTLSNGQLTLYTRNNNDTGIAYSSKTPSGVVSNGDLISKRQAMIYSLILG